MEQDDSRQLKLNNHGFDGKSVLYIMARDQRTQSNHALLYAQSLALQHGVPLRVAFLVRKTAQPRSREHYNFMLAGLEEVAQDLNKKFIPFVLRKIESYYDALDLVHDAEAGAVVFDFSPLKGPRTFQKKVASTLKIPVVTVDTHNIIPAWKVSDKQEFAAHTMRRKVHKQLHKYLIEPSLLKSQEVFPTTVASSSFDDMRQWVNDNIDESGIKIAAKPGPEAAQAALTDFLTTRLESYASKRNDFSEDFQSELSPYLHYGQLSSLEVALDTIEHVNAEPLLFREARMAQAGDSTSSEDGMNALFEEMIVRKELSDNFCLYSPSYLTLDAAPAWARQSLGEHEGDQRDATYTREQWEAAKTHDEAWNAAQLQLRATGKIHGYMRMYWAKKMLEWSPTAKAALEDCIYLNDKYSVDGGDPNGYVGILWSIAGLHDRPWIEREVFGKIRYMNAKGLARKFDLDGYVARWTK